MSVNNKIRRKWRNQKTGQIREFAMSEKRALGHGFVPYEEEVAENVMDKIPSNPAPLPAPSSEKPDADEPENAALSKPTATDKPKQTRKPRGRKPAAKK